MNSQLWCSHPKHSWGRERVGSIRSGWCAWTRFLEHVPSLSSIPALLQPGLSICKLHKDSQEAQSFLLISETFKSGGVCNGNKPAPVFNLIHLQAKESSGSVHWQAVYQRDYKLTHNKGTYLGKIGCWVIFFSISLLAQNVWLSKSPDYEFFSLKIVQVGLTFIYSCTYRSRKVSTLSISTKQIGLHFRIKCQKKTGKNYPPHFTLTVKGVSDYNTEGKFAQFNGTLKKHCT